MKALNLKERVKNHEDFNLQTRVENYEGFKKKFKWLLN